MPYRLPLPLRASRLHLPSVAQALGQGKRTGALSASLPVLACSPSTALYPSSTSCPFSSLPQALQRDYTDTYIKTILGSVRTIALVGASANWNRPSYFAMKYLQKKGYRVIPVNPGREMVDRSNGERI